MNLYVPALWVATGITLFAGVHFSATGLPRRENRMYVAFGWLSLLVGVYFLLTAIEFQSVAAIDVGGILRLRMGVVCGIYVLAVWFFGLYTQLRHRRRWLLGAVVLFGTLFLINLACPDSLLFTDIIPRLSIVLPWGETVLDYKGVHSPFFWIFYGVQNALYLWLIGCCAALWKRHERRLFWTLAVYLLFQLGTGVHAELVSAYALRTVTFDAFTSLALVMLMSNALRDQQIRRSLALSASLHDLGVETSRRQAVQANLQHIAYHDALTDLPNRRQLYLQLEQALAGCRQAGTHGAFIVLGLDRFKVINDALGHELGDQLLLAAIARLREVHAGGDGLSRVGGDEFGVLLTDLAGDVESATRQAGQRAQELAQGFARPLHVLDHELVVGVSLGITVFPHGQDDVEDIQRQASMALHRAKKSGRNKMVTFAQPMQHEADRRLMLERSLRQALTRGEFGLHYQPQMNAQGRFTGMEAVLRWTHPQLGEIEPDEFIPLAEETGLIHPLGRLVLHLACHKLAQWSQQQPWRGHLAVNISPWQLFAQDFVQVVSEAVHASGCDPARLVLEITESAFLHDLDEVALKMRSLNALGLRFSIDDFGSGYTSLACLRRLPISELKIDRLFVQALRDGSGDRLLEAIIGIAHHLGLTVIAEGVETEAQRDMLFAMGCDACQGYLISHPLAEPTLIAWMGAALVADDQRDGGGSLPLFAPALP